MTGLQEAARETKGLQGRYGRTYVQISYDLSDGQVLADYLTQNDWKRYHSSSIIHVCNASSPMTMQQIADAVAAAIAYSGDNV